MRIVKRVLLIIVIKHFLINNMSTHVLEMKEHFAALVSLMQCNTMYNQFR